MSVVFTVYTVHSQFNSVPTKTKVSSKAGLKFIPLRWTRVPPLKLPDDGDTELTIS